LPFARVSPEFSPSAPDLTGQAEGSDRSREGLQMVVRPR
jgi:hypothetical protein